MFAHKMEIIYAWVINVANRIKVLNRIVSIKYVPYHVHNKFVLTQYPANHRKNVVAMQIANVQKLNL